MKIENFKKFRTLCKHYIKNGFGVDAWFWDAIDENMNYDEKREHFNILRNEVNDIRGIMNNELDEILNLAVCCFYYEDNFLSDVQEKMNITFADDDNDNLLSDVQEKTNFILTGNTNTSIKDVKTLEEPMGNSDSSFIDSTDEIWVDSTCEWVAPEKEDDGVYFIDSSSTEEEPEPENWQNSTC